MFDILIKNGTIVDGTGVKRHTGDIGIKKGKITKISPVITTEAETIIDATDKIVSPGFIDNHSHGDYYFLFGTPGHNLLEQGVTTEIAGNCGGSIVPYYEGSLDDAKGLAPDDLIEEVKQKTVTFQEFERAVSKMNLGTNMAFLVGHGNLRAKVMGFSGERPTKQQVDRMRDLVSDAMKSGFIGLSSGLIYPPSVYATKEELISLASVVASYDGIFATHIRGEGDTVVKAVEEAIEIGERSGCDVVIAHHKIGGLKSKGKSSITLGLMEQANKRGYIRVRCDTYPFTAGQTSLTASIPPKFAEKGLKSLIEQLKDPDCRKAIKEEMENDESESLLRYSGFDGALILRAPKTPEYVGMTLSAVSGGVSDPFDTVFDLIIKNGGNIQIAYFYINKEDMMNIIKTPEVMIGADVGHDIDYFDSENTGGGHPRAISTFPKYLRIIREGKIMPLEDAIRRITFLPAETARIDQIGLLLEGYQADVCIFDWDRISETNDYSHPFRRNQGIEYVIVKGNVAVEKGKYNGSKSGTWLKRRTFQVCAKQDHYGLK